MTDVESTTPRSPLSHQSPATKDDLPSPTPPFATERPSRPLSEISNNSDRRRSIATSLKDKNEKPSRPSSRPVSEIRDGDILSSVTVPQPKRVSSTAGIQTLTVNLVEYARQQGSTSAPPVTTPATRDAQNLTVSRPASSIAPAPPSPSTKPAALSRDNSGTIASSSSTPAKKEDAESSKDAVKEDQAGERDRHVSDLYTIKRASLRQTQLRSATTPSTLPPEPVRTSSEPTPLPSKPFIRSKPKWLKRASVTPARSKSKSPIGDPVETPTSASMTASASLPPALPTRKGKGGLVPSESSKPGLGSMLPPELPARGSQTNLSHSGMPPPLPSRDNLNLRTRIAAWGGNGFTRSESSSSIASASGSINTTLNNAQQRLPKPAQRVFGHAGSAVSKGWAGLRARGVAGSISGMSSFNPSSKRSGMEPSTSWSSGLVRKASRDRLGESRMEVPYPAGDGPVFQEGVVKRAGGDRSGRVFGREIVDTGRVWGVADIGDVVEKETEWEKRRLACLPALVIRTVEYLEIWGPKEEGIFRISGRSSHIARLRKEFDSGADLDLRECHPGDLDPHAVSGIFKSYLRELPSPILTTALAPKFDACVSRKGDAKEPSSSSEEGDEETEDLPTLLSQLPSAHWFLLADIVKLLDLIPKHTSVNRMTLNAVMLSLGPSLNISGSVLTELLANRDALFSVPPPISGTETASAVINFGDLDIAPPVLSTTPSQEDTSSPVAADQASIASASPSTASKRRGAKLMKKSSLNKIFGAVTSSPSKASSMETMSSSFVEVAPPRVDVPVAEPLSPLPSFEEITTEEAKECPPEAEPREELADASSSKSQDLGTDTPDDGSKPAKPSERPPNTPTPIADRFSNPNIHLPSLRAPRGSVTSESITSHSTPPPDTLSRHGQTPGTGSDSILMSLAGSSSLPSTPNTNPATVIRRGAPVFFQSAVQLERTRSSRSRSASVTASATATPSNPGAGVKRKEESPLSAGTTPAGKEGGARIKRLSAGPGPVNVKEVIRSMEMTA